MSWTFASKLEPINQRRRVRRSLHDHNTDLALQPLDCNSINTLYNVFRGRYDRMERYKTYDWMDYDSDVSRALDIISEHCTSKDHTTGLHHIIDWRIDEPGEDESTTLREIHDYWSKLNNFDISLFEIIRGVIKYGDWFLFRNPDTFELYDIHPKFVLGAVVSRHKLEILGWIIRDFKFNVEDMELVVDNKVVKDAISNLGQNIGVRSTRIVSSKHIIHLSMNGGKFTGSSTDDDPTDGYSNRWPYGESWLEKGYKIFKQRELLEDAYLIHRTQRAPTRLVWHVYTGRQRPDRASSIMSDFMNNLNQKRIPQITENGTRTIDSVYNTQSQLEDYFIPVSSDSRGSKVETLDGNPWDTIPDLDYFTKKLMRALRVPVSWMGIGNEQSVYNDARVGVAYQEEIEFSAFCTRIQDKLISVFDFEFKMFSKWKGARINSADFRLTFNPPTNYEDYKKNARVQENISIWSQLKDEPFISQRFALKSLLNWTDADIIENEKLLIEERKNIESDPNSVVGGGLGGGFGGGLPPPLSGDQLGGLGGDLTANQDIGGGSVAGAEGAGAFGGNVGGGLGESQRSRNMINEAALTSSDLDNVSLNKEKRPYNKRTPDDKTFDVMDTIAGKTRPVTTLSIIRKLRLKHMDSRIEDQKRMKRIQNIYSRGSEDTGGLPGVL